MGHGVVCWLWHTAACLYSWSVIDCCLQINYATARIMTKKLTPQNVASVPGKQLYHWQVNVSVFVSLEGEWCQVCAVIDWLFCSYLTFILLGSLWICEETFSQCVSVHSQLTMLLLCRQFWNVCMSVNIIWVSSLMKTVFCSLCLWQNQVG